MCVFFDHTQRQIHLALGIAVWELNWAFIEGLVSGWFPVGVAWFYVGFIV